MHLFWKARTAAERGQTIRAIVSGNSDGYADSVGNGPAARRRASLFSCGRPAAEDDQRAKIAVEQGCCVKSDPRVADLLVQWEDLHEQGQSVEPEELCAECPEFLEELKRRIQILESMKDRLDTVPYVPQPAAEPQNEFPAAIGRYRVEKLLGRGGFGLVYLAYDDQLQRQVAIKVPHTRLVTRGDQAEAYLAEARTVANLDHPQIVPVYDVGSTADFPCYVVSKYIDGTDLTSSIKQSRLPVRVAAALVATEPDSATMY